MMNISLDKADKELCVIIDVSPVNELHPRMKAMQTFESYDLEWEDGIKAKIEIEVVFNHRREDDCEGEEDD